MNYLVDEVNKLGMKFGIWMELEMISPGFGIVQRASDWAIVVKGRTGTLSRNQYVLDFSRKDVRTASMKSHGTNIFNRPDLLSGELFRWWSTF